MRYMLTFYRLRLCQWLVRILQWMRGQVWPDIPHRHQVWSHQLRSKVLPPVLSAWKEWERKTPEVQGRCLCRARELAGGEPPLVKREERRHPGPSPLPAILSGARPRLWGLHQPRLLPLCEEQRLRLSPPWPGLWLPPSLRPGGGRENHWQSLLRQTSQERQDQRGCHRPVYEQNV